MFTHQLTGRLHSTKTALLKIQNDIAASMDYGKAVVLTLLELSAAFDNIDHNILFNCLRDCFGVDGMELSAITSFLHFALPSSVISFPVSMSVTIYMLMTPKYI